MSKHRLGRGASHRLSLGHFNQTRPALRFEDGTVMTEGELWALKSDPKYWRAGDIDPSYRAAVDKAFEDTYGLGT